MPKKNDRLVREGRKGIIELHEKDTILLFGEPGTSKTFSLLKACQDNPDNLFFMIDPDGGAHKGIKELGGPGKFDNLEYRLTPDWEDIFSAYQEAWRMLLPGDWLLIDQMGRLWDLAQDYFSRYAYGESASTHLLEVIKNKIEAERKLKEMREKNPNVEMRGEMSAMGFETNKEWISIKKLHNSQVVDHAVVRGTFNMMATSAAKELLPLDRSAKGDFAKKFLQLFTPYGFKPEGEKHNIYRFDTIAYLNRMVDKEAHEVGYFAEIIRERGNNLLVSRTLEITGEGFWRVYDSSR